MSVSTNSTKKDLINHRAVVVTALPVEYNAVRALLTNIAEDEHPDGDVYERGLFHADERIWGVGIVEMGMGNPNAAQKTERAIAHFRPDVVFFVGVAGGIKDVTLGDVVVATKVYGYHAGKAADEFRTRPEVGLPQYRILERARAESRKTNWQKRLTPIPDPAPRVFLGAIAAGEQVVTSTQSESYQLIRNAYNDALAVEMESYGFLKAAQAHSGLEALAVRGISDLLEGKAEADRGGSQERASRHAAAFAFEVLANLTLPDKTVRTEIREVIREIPATPTTTRSTLPRQPYFFGRERELTTIADAISPESRTWGALIYGPGGIGKTALAIEGAHRAPLNLFEKKVFVSAKERELTARGEVSSKDFSQNSFFTILNEIASQLKEDGIPRLAPEERANALKLALTTRKILIVLDNLETLSNDDREHIYQFLDRLPEGNKAIITSRRRDETVARTIRLDQLQEEEAEKLISELAKGNPRLHDISDIDKKELFFSASGNPLVIRWIVGQVGRDGSTIKTIEDAIKFMKHAPPDNDPLEYVFGDLLNSLTPSEKTVLTVMVYLSRSPKAEWIAKITSYNETKKIEMVWEELVKRSILVTVRETKEYFLPDLTRQFVINKLPKEIANMEGKLASYAFKITLEFGGRKNIEAQANLARNWPVISAALPYFIKHEDDNLQIICDALDMFLRSSGKWDEWLWLNQQAEIVAIISNENESAGDRAYKVGLIYSYLGKPNDVLQYATRAEKHWLEVKTAKLSVKAKMRVNHLRGIGYKLIGDYSKAIEIINNALSIWGKVEPDGVDVAVILNTLGEIQMKEGEMTNSKEQILEAEKNFTEAITIALKHDRKEDASIYMGNLANIALRQGEWLRLEALANYSLELAKEFGQQDEIARENLHLAIAYLNLGQRKSDGLKASQKAVEIYKRLGHKNLPDAEAILSEWEK